MRGVGRAIAVVCGFTTLVAGCAWLGATSPSADDWGARADAALQAAERDALVHRVSVGGADLVVFRPSRAALIDAAGGPLQPALVRAVRDEGWALAINASFVRIHPPDVGSTRGAVWRADQLVDPAETGSDALWTLDVKQTEHGLSLDAHRGDPARSVGGRLFALGGLEALVAQGKLNDSPTFTNQLRRFGAERGDVGRTYVAWRSVTGVLAVFVCDLGAHGPALAEVPRVLASLGFDAVWMLDGGPSSALVLREDGQVVVRAENEPPPGMNLRFGLAFSP